MSDDPYDERDEDTQRFTSTYADSSFLEAIEQCRREDQLPTTVAVAEIVGCTRQSAHYRLTSLAEEGRVESQDAGGSLVWAVVDDK